MEDVTVFKRGSQVWASTVSHYCAKPKCIHPALDWIDIVVYIIRYETFDRFTMWDTKPTLSHNSVYHSQHVSELFVGTFCAFFLSTKTKLVLSWECTFLTESLKLLRWAVFTFYFFFTLLIDLQYYLHLVILFAQEQDSCLGRLNTVGNW